MKQLLSDVPRALAALVWVYLAISLALTPACIGDSNVSNPTPHPGQSAPSAPGSDESEQASGVGASDLNRSEDSERVSTIPSAGASPPRSDAALPADADPSGDTVDGPGADGEGLGPSDVVHD